MSLPNNLLALDIEPGGRTQPTTRIGICPVTRGESGEPWMMTFPSPLHTLDNYAAAAAGLREFSALIEGQTLSFFNARYDASAIRKLFAACAMLVPHAAYFCGLSLARSGWMGANRPRELSDWVRTLGLLNAEEIDVRRTLHKLVPQQRWLLSDAGDDALALARLIRFYGAVEVPPLRHLSPSPRNEQTRM